MVKKVWIHGPIAVDTVLYLANFPAPGSFMNSLRKEERIGGTAANVALGLCTADVETGLVGYLGRDINGKKLQEILDKSLIKDKYITYIDGETSHAVILVDDNSERTIISTTVPYLRQLRMDGVPVQNGDVVAFILWREEFCEDLQKMNSAGCFTVVGAGALSDPMVEHADLLIGSYADFPGDIDPKNHLNRFGQIVLTRGIDGSSSYTSQGELHQSAMKVDAVDSTGAGDAFIAGYLAGLAHGLNIPQILQIAAQWAASSVQVKSSVPPAFENVKQEWGIRLIP